MTSYQWALLGIASSSVVINLLIAAHLFLRRNGLGVQLLYPSASLNPASGHGTNGAELSLLNQGRQFIGGLDDGQAASGIHASRQAQNDVNARLAIDRQKSYLIDGNGKIAQVDDFYRDPWENAALPSGRANISANTQSHAVAPDKPNHVADAQYQAGCGNNQCQPIKPIHASASLSKEKEACPCNLLL